MPLRRTLALATLLVATNVHAQPTTDKTDKTVMDEGRARFNEGMKLAEAGDHGAARIKFEQAYSLLKLSSVLYNLARAEQLSGRSLEALQHYRVIAKSTDPKVTPAMKRTAETAIADLVKAVGQIAIDAPSGARLSVDGRTVDRDADPIAVMPGKHTIEATIEGKTETATRDVPAGSVTTVTFAAPAAPPPPPPRAAVAPPPPEPEPKSNRNLVGGLLAGGAVAAGGVSLAFLLVSNSKADDAAAFNDAAPGGACRTLGPSCTEYGAQLDDASSARTISVVALAGAGAFAVASAAAFIFWPRAKPARVGSLGFEF